MAGPFPRRFADRVIAVKHQAKFHEAEEQREQNWQARSGLNWRRPPPRLPSRLCFGPPPLRDGVAPQSIRGGPAQRLPVPFACGPITLHQDHGYCSTSITDVPPSVNVLGSPGQCTGGVAVALPHFLDELQSVVARVPVHFAVACAWVPLSAAVLRPAHPALVHSVKRRRRRRQVRAELRRFGLRRSCNSGRLAAWVAFCIP